MLFSYGCGAKPLSDIATVAERDTGASLGLNDEMTMTGLREGSARVRVRGMEMGRPM